MKRLAIITARGGSKRIPRKNIRSFLGKPIIDYPIQAAIASGVFDEIMVSTDDKEIADYSRKAGAKIPFMRSEATSNDFATTADVIAEVIEEYKNRGLFFDQICCIYPTAPFVSAVRLKEAMEKLKEPNTQCVMPVVRFEFPPQRGVILADGKLQPKWTEYILSRSQDLEPMYHDAGQFYCLDTTAFLEQKKIIMKVTKPVFLSEREVQDIDTQEDWDLAELKYRMLHDL